MECGAVFVEFEFTVLGEVRPFFHLEQFVWGKRDEVRAPRGREDSTGIAVLEKGMTGESSLQGGVSTALRRAVTNSEKACDSERMSVLSFPSGALSDGGRYAPQIGEIVVSLKRLKDEMSTDLSALEEGELVRKTKRQCLMKAETKEVSVLTKAIGEKETVASKLEQSAKKVVEVAKAVEAADAVQQRVDEAAIEQSSAEAQERADAQPRPTRPPPWRDKLQSTGMHERKPKLEKLLRP